MLFDFGCVITVVVKLCRLFLAMNEWVRQRLTPSPKASYIRGMTHMGKIIGTRGAMTTNSE